MCETTGISIVFHDRADESDGYDLSESHIDIQCLLLYANVVEPGSLRQCQFVL